MRVGGAPGPLAVPVHAVEPRTRRARSNGCRRWSSKLQAGAGLVDVTTDREQGGLQANVVIDRAAASRLGVRIQDIDNALNNAFSQRQISTIYTQRNQYRVILEVDPRFQRDPSDLDAHLRARRATARRCRSPAWRGSSAALAPLVVNHQGQFPAVTITYNLAPGMTLDERQRGDRAGGRRAAHARHRCAPSSPATPRRSRSSAGAQPLLILAALLAVYIVLGVLYESLLHPLTIISTLPSAGLGALLALQLFRHRADA